MKKSGAPTLVLHDRRKALEPGLIVFDRHGDKLRLHERVPGDATDWTCHGWVSGGWSAETRRLQPADIEYVEVLPKRVAA